MPLLFWVLGGFGVGSLFGLSAGKGLNKVLFVVLFVASLMWLKGGR
ncbi:conserved hypothetical protein [Vibrio chagasii]|nr:conserved hypothetical protein [Vibrio chagasii]CAH6944469.1 conserved hypothetical protein [Vibrio chagasii]CAH7180034.1 conserved hypothetical protein [Vibrio chagasii]CAH7180150.1 conserved hypothetical protein [Vibrio chagasii]